MASKRADSLDHFLLFGLSLMYEDIQKATTLRAHRMHVVLISNSRVVASAIVLAVVCVTPACATWAQSALCVLVRRLRIVVKGTRFVHRPYAYPTKLEGTKPIDTTGLYHVILAH